MDSHDFQTITPTSSANRTITNQAAAWQMSLKIASPETGSPRSSALGRVEGAGVRAGRNDSDISKCSRGLRYSYLTESVFLSTLSIKPLGRREYCNDAQNS